MWGFETFFLDQTMGKQTSNKERKKMIKSTKVDIDEVALNEIKNNSKSFKELCWSYFVKNKREIYKYNSETKKFDFIEKAIDLTYEIGFLETRNYTIISGLNYFFYFDDDENFSYFITKNEEIKKFEIAGWISPMYDLVKGIDKFSFKITSFKTKNDLYILFINNNISIIEAKKDVWYTNYGNTYGLFDFNEHHFNLNLDARDVRKFSLLYTKSTLKEEISLWMNFNYSFPLTNYSFIKEINLSKMFDYWVFRIQFDYRPFRIQDSKELKNDDLFCFANGLKWYYLFSKINRLNECKYSPHHRKKRYKESNLFLKDLDKEFKYNFNDYHQQERFNTFNCLIWFPKYHRLNLILANNNKVFCYLF